MIMPREEEVFADGYIKVPVKRWYHIADALSRQDELMEAMLKVLGKINEKLAAPIRITPPAVPSPAAPPTIEIKPITDRLDLISKDLDNYLYRIKGLPIAAVNRYAGAATTWQTVTSWNVGHVWSKRYGELREVSMVSNNFPNTRFRLRVELGDPIRTKITLFTELQLLAALTLPFPENELPYDTWVYLDCRSIGPAIVVDGSITGSEWSLV